MLDISSERLTGPPKVINASKEAIEFESFTLNREKVVTPGETIIVHLPALRPGSYDFYDDFHQDVPEGSIVAKQSSTPPRGRGG
jgi:Cupredoxin-like domain